jgi:hypothetical protein
VRPGREPYHQDPPERIPERRYRLAPVFPITVRPPLCDGDLSAMVAQPGTLAAGDEFGLKNFEHWIFTSFLQISSFGFIVLEKAVAFFTGVLKFKKKLDALLAG